MRFLISGGGWPINGGAWLIPAGTIIDTATWTNIPTQMPMDAIALDAASAQQQFVTYSVDYGRLWPLIVCGPGVNRAAAMSAAATAIGWLAYPAPPVGYIPF